MSTRPIERYDRIAITLHWLMALMIIGNISLGHIMVALPKIYRPSLAPIHIWIGLTVFMLTALRVYWRATHLKPANAISYEKWELSLSGFAHFVFYVLMVALPITGYLFLSANPPAKGLKLTFWKIIELPFYQPFYLMEPTAQKVIHDNFVTAHAIGAWLLVATLALHLAGVVKHHLVDNDRIIERMNPFRKRSEAPEF